MTRRLTAIPGVVLFVCLFLPALRVCNAPEAPSSFPPCYAAYIGGIGIVIMAIARRAWLVKVGAAIPPVLGVLTVGGIAVCMAWSCPLFAAVVGAITTAFAILVIREFVRKLPSERALAWIAFVQGFASAAWAASLAFDPDGLWGARVTLCAALALVVTARAWLSENAIEPPVPRATLC